MCLRDLGLHGGGAEGVLEAGALGCQEFGSVFGDEHLVFEADAEFAREVDAGFVGEDHIGGELLVVSGDEVGPLVHVQTDAVADTVGEVGVARTVAGGDDDRAGGGVYRLHFDARARGGERGGLGVVDVLEDFALQVGGGSVNEAARDVGGVALDGAAVVDENHLLFSNGLGL